VTAVDAVGTEPAGATNGAIGSGVTAFRTKVVTVTTAGVRGGTSPIQIGAVSSRAGVGVIHSEVRPQPPDHINDTGRGGVRGARGQTPARGTSLPPPTLQLGNTLLAGVIERAGVAGGMSLHIFTVWLVASATLSSDSNMDSFRKILLNSRIWISALAVAALSIGTWSIVPAPVNAAGVIGGGIPFPGLYAQYPYYPYPPGYYPYYPPPAPAYSPAPSYPPLPSYPPQAGRSVGNIARQLNQQELNFLQAAPFNPPPPPYYPYPPPPRY
jgi:hypothetical protein